jgi:hypothetical protein
MFCSERRRAVAVAIGTRYGHRRLAWIVNKKLCHRPAGRYCSFRMSAILESLQGREVHRFDAGQFVIRQGETQTDASFFSNLMAVIRPQKTWTHKVSAAMILASCHAPYSCLQSLWFAR